ncbi:glycosyltransferase family 92 protein [Methylococcaceae bacterium WWC4]|nr:glycosyltransferase family 92 protein [Methylococcaceae bacterium WWC4]
MRVLLSLLKRLGKKVSLDVAYNFVQLNYPIWVFYFKKLTLPNFGGRHEIKISGKPAIYDVFVSGDKNYVVAIGRYDRVVDWSRLICVFDSGCEVIGQVVEDFADEKEAYQVSIIKYLIPSGCRSKPVVLITLKLDDSQIVNSLQLSNHSVELPRHKLSVTTLMKDEDRFIPEWIAYYRMIGVSHFYIYDNRSLKRRRIRNLLAPLIAQGIVTLIDWDYPYVSGAPDNSWRFCQRGQMHHCLYKYGSFSDWMLFIDVDEFIYPVNAEQDFLRFLESREHPNIAALQFKMIWFGNSGFEQVPKGLIINNYIRRSPEVLSLGREKCAVRPQLTKLMFIHGVKACEENSWMEVVSPELFRINHYYATSSKRQFKGYSDHNDVEDTGMRKYVDSVEEYIGKI